MIADSDARNSSASLSDEDAKVLDATCRMIAPVWPLDRWIAVNPWWGMRHLPMARVDRLLGQRGAVPVLPELSFYDQHWQSGRITRSDLTMAIAEIELAVTPDDCLRQLEQAAQFITVKGVVPRLTGLVSGRDAVLVNQISQICQRYFDQRQALWGDAGKGASLYTYWREQTLLDRNLDSVPGMPALRAQLKSVPADTGLACARVIAAMGLSGDDLQAWCHSLLLSINGWASWCRGLLWRAELEGRQSQELHDLLAIVMVWEMLCLQTGDDSVRHHWQTGWLRYHRESLEISESEHFRLVWQRAYELGYQRALLSNLTAHRSADLDSPRIQAVFCIDVRSEPLRRHLERANQDIRTSGFAGFFGIPLADQRPGEPASDPVHRLPGLLTPSVILTHSTGSSTLDHQLIRRQHIRQNLNEAVRRARTDGLSTFSLVEATGLASGWALLRDSLGLARKDKSAPSMNQRLFQRNGGDPLTDTQRIDIAENLLRGLSLTGNFAPLLVMVGHGSHTDNNPNQAGLDCGACGGQAGGTNARAAASLLNESIVRAGLADRGLAIPDFTWVVAAEHCTVTDQVRILDRERVPASHSRHLKIFAESLEAAGRDTRRERAGILGLNGRSDDELLQAMDARTRNWAEVRPEWGLANNAAIIFAPRARTRGLDLGGRCFLHDYDPQLDPDGAILTALMSAPMVVANWINLQYFSSVAAPAFYGSGNKVLHSVVGGNIGVIEGNEGDLRIGLPWQSVHDGERFRHEPLRLTVVVNAPAERIQAVLESQPDVARLVENEWLFLCRLGEGGEVPEWYRRGQWHRFSSTLGACRT